MHSFQEIARLLNCPLPQERLISSVQVDSRKVVADSLFFALPGEKTDGHFFLHRAVEAGAKAAVVSREYVGQSFGLDLLYVDDPLHALQRLAQHWIRQQDATIIAVTGSVGKTTTKRFIETFLKEVMNVSSSPWNYNSQIGLPLALLNHVKGSEEALVLEMAMTHPEQISRLVEIATPDIALITTVSHAHSENFSSLKEIVEAKAEILSHPKTRIGILPFDHPDFDLMKHRGSCEKIGFSLKSSDADYFYDSNTRSLTYGGQTHQLPPLPFLGSHLIANVIAAIAVADACSVGWDAIEQAISKLTLPEKRMQIVKKQGITFLNDTYNASTLSMKGALDAFPEVGAIGRKIAVLGDMPELGGFSAECHEEVARYALGRVDQLYCVGPESKRMAELWRNEGQEADWYASREELETKFDELFQDGDTVLVKGANCLQMWKLLEKGER